MGFVDKITVKYEGHELDIEDITYSGDEPIIVLGNNLGQQLVVNYKCAVVNLKRKEDKELLDYLVRETREGLK